MLKICKFLFVFVKLALVWNFRKYTDPCQYDPPSFLWMFSLLLKDLISDFIFDITDGLCFYLEYSYFYRRSIKYFIKKIMKNVMFYDFIYLAKGFRMRLKVWSTLNNDSATTQIRNKSVPCWCSVTTKLTSKPQSSVLCAMRSCFYIERVCTLL